MPVADDATYVEMLQRARDGRFACGVVKMNLDTDMQYAFTRAVADHCFRHYDGVLRVDGEVGDKKAYDPRTYLSAAERTMANRVRRAAQELRSAGKALVHA